MKVAVASLAGAPGVSTLVAAMAAASTGPLLVVECPPDGGVLAVRWGWPRDHAAVDRTGDGDGHMTLWDQARPWVGASRLLAADPSAIAMRRAAMARWVAARIGPVAQPTLVDLGRLQPDDDTIGLLRELDRLWLLVDPTVEQTTAAATWRPLLERTCAVELVTAGARRRSADGRYVAAEVADTLQWPLVAELVVDRRAAAALRGVGAPGPWLLPRLPLVRQAGELLARLDGAPTGLEVDR